MEQDPIVKTPDSVSTESEKSNNCPICGKPVKNLGSHMKAHKDAVPSVQQPKGVTKTQKNVQEVILKDTLGEEAFPEDYFYNGVIPSGFAGTCGKPVDDEELLKVFNKIFNPSYKFLFYRAKGKEVYIVIVPIKYSTIIGEEKESLDGDFQKHAISFINEGSVNIDTLKNKLSKVLKFCKFDID
jgi:hypothetical protein